MPPGPRIRAVPAAHPASRADGVAELTRFHHRC